MSPWGKLYLSQVEYHFGWHTAFSSWRMHYIMSEIVFHFGWNKKITNHLDKLSIELRG